MPATTAPSRVIGMPPAPGNLASGEHSVRGVGGSLVYFLDSTSALGRVLIPAMKKQALEELIDEKLKLQEAKKQNVGGELLCEVS